MGGCSSIDLTMQGEALHPYTGLCYVECHTPLNSVFLQSSESSEDVFPFSFPSRFTTWSKIINVLCGLINVLCDGDLRLTWWSKCAFHLSK